ncbi:dihydroorotate dehydrogenase [Puttea exsequens]|nr:dihydroorotate dehydrogenase [Puttea exsequens]
MPLNFDPPLLNSASPWATDEADLQALYDCPHTGAITTRTSSANGFAHADSTHQYCFFSPTTKLITKHSAHTAPHPPEHHPPSSSEPVSSLNTLGYSPYSTDYYLYTISQILQHSPPSARKKPIIISVTGTPQEITTHYRAIAGLCALFETEYKWTPRLLMEINLSCPNIADVPPPAYSPASLLEYLDELSLHHSATLDAIEVGIKTPPYTYQTQFEDLISALLQSCKRGPCPTTFITATNTLGNALVLSADNRIPALNSSNGSGIGGLAGAALHPIALGNVKVLRGMLDLYEELKGVEIIGVGGVGDRGGFESMTTVGAAAVGVGSALGAEGVGVFERILGVENEGGK